MHFSQIPASASGALTGFGMSHRIQRHASILMLFDAHHVWHLSEPGYFQLSFPLPYAPLDCLVMR
jgi:hypothetical protein